MQDVASEEDRSEQIKLMRKEHWELVGKEIKNSDVVLGVHKKLIGVHEKQLVEKAS